MSREDPQLRIRLPIELKEKIQEAAAKNNRSMNAEIVSILEDSFLCSNDRDKLYKLMDNLDTLIENMGKFEFIGINKK